MRSIVPAAVLIATFFLSPSLLADDDVELIPNDVKYSDTSIPNATGRDGGASIQARALLGQDGVTDVEVTTGSFDGGAAPGNVDKVQVKAGNLETDALTRNFNGLANGGFTTVRLTDLPLAPRSAIQIQANVSGVDPNRVGVITVSETVKRRPDLSVSNFQFAPQAIAGHLVTFYGRVWERNGDVGARADCVLRANGAEIDRARGIWVDRNGMVSCEMANVFATPGTYQVQFSIENVSPGDWNPANNVTWDSPITIRHPSEVLSGGSYLASARETISERIYTRTQEPGPYGFDNEHSQMTDTGRLTTLSAAVPAELDWSSLNVTVSEESDGNLLQFAQSQRVFIQPGDWPRPGCSILRFSRTGTFYACIGGGVTTIEYARGSRGTRYLSRSWGEMYIYGGTTRPYDRTMDMYMPSGGHLPYGSTVQLELIASDASRIWQINPFITMQPFTEPENVSSGSGSDWKGPYTWTRREWTHGTGGTDTEAND